MNRTFRFQVRKMSLFGCVKRSKKVLRAIFHDGRAKPILVSDHTKEAGLVITTGLPLVLKVCATGNVAQIHERIVGSASIDVIDVANGPFARDVKPRKSVFPCDFPGQSNLSIAENVQGASACANFNSVTGLNLLREEPGLRVVVQKAAQSLGGYLFHRLTIHDLKGIA